MTTEHKQTREEEACERLAEVMWEELSEAACTVLDEAHLAAYKMDLMRNYCYQPEEYDEAVEKMRAAAVKLTDRDCELLRAYVRATIAAFASIDRYDDETLVGRKVYRSHLSRYYQTIWEMIDNVLEWSFPFRREAAKRDPIDPLDLSF
jgi:hypothetical protein